MDEGGEGWVNMGSVEAAAKKDLSMATRFHFVREHTLHGTVTGMESVCIMSTYEDQLDRLLVSFKDAKRPEAAHDLVTISIHAYERAPQMVSLDSPLLKTELGTDPLSRCGVDISLYARNEGQSQRQEKKFAHSEISESCLDQFLQRTAINPLL
ncbi:hypothetical protein AZE42_05187 [Rhizopogon vesiculosus]|uniref:Uncharacterized protein n=1 Tax=Rhizopogon vesiculosus TaxID=180088 RepID=A0A1J8Q9M2_9AGAM|nr:hypothetical protein AZE42_05187 [Rhizopogon vesiculosus]